jgi:hypothetical protein
LATPESSGKENSFNVIEHIKKVRRARGEALMGLENSVLKLAREERIDSSDIKWGSMLRMSEMIGGSHLKKLNDQSNSASQVLY